MKAFIVLRILDIISTLININLYGIGIETNPLMRFMLKNNIYLLWQGLMIGLLVYSYRWLKKNKLFRIGLTLFNILTAITVLSNFYLLI